MSIEHYANPNETFSNQSPSEPLFDEKQFKDYRVSEIFTIEKFIQK